MLFRSGGGGGNPATGGAGGSGIVVIKEPEGAKNVAPGVWNINTVYTLVKSGEWTGF